jgi:hypothetical protein
VGWLGSKETDGVPARPPSLFLHGTAVLPRYKIAGLEIPIGCSGALFVVQRVNILGDEEELEGAAHVHVAVTY